MSKGQALKALVNERLTAAAEEIFALVERTIAEYEQELCRSEKENQRKQRLLDAVLNPRVLLPRAKTEVLSPSPCPPRPGQNHEVTQARQIIKEEPNEKSIQFEEEQLQVFATGEIAVCVVKEEALLHQRQTEPGVETREEEISSEMDGDTDSDSSSDTGSDDDSSTTDSDDACSYTGLDDTGGAPFGRSDAQMETEADGDVFNTVQLGDRSTNVQKSTLHLKHKCTVCQRKFKSERGLFLHSRVHREDYCPLCVKKNGKKVTREEHMKAHAHLKPFSCPFCKLSFDQMNQLELHMKVHSGDKTYTCSVCKKTFSQKGTLDAHAKVHAGEKPWSCALCHKDFTNVHNLRVHMKTHI